MCKNLFQQRNPNTHKFKPLPVWRNLDSKQKYNMLTRLFFTHSTIPMFENNKISIHYTRIRNFFKKQENILSIYEYLYNLDEEIKFNNLSDFFVAMDKYFIDKRFEQKTQVKQYKDINLDSILNL